MSENSSLSNIILHLQELSEYVDYLEEENEMLRKTINALLNGTETKITIRRI